jgi:hypothetical protein
MLAVIRRFAPMLSLSLIVAAAASLAPASAQAADTYTSRAETCGSSRGHVSNDVNGIAYAACGRNIVRFDANGRRLTSITVGTLGFASVAVSPDAKYIYAVVASRLIRLDRQANGTYKQSTTWAPKPFSLNNVGYLPTPRNIVTDEFGNIYVSNNGTDPVTRKIAPTRIIKYAPSGAVMTHFGSHGDEPGNPYAFYQNRGLAATRDGRSLYVTSHLQGQVRRFDLQADGSFAYAQTIGTADTNCASTGGLAAPSDVGVDPWGFVYIPDTSCRKLKKFTNDGKYIATIGTGTKVLHEVGVTRRGDVFAGEWDRFYLRSATNPVPGPIPAITRPVIDTTAPVLTRIALPATVDSRNVKLAVTATDAVGIAQARVANEDGNWGAWKAYTNPLPHTLTAGNSYKVVYLQVRDAAGNESGVSHLVTQLVDEVIVVVPGPEDRIAPTLTQITIPTATMSRNVTVDLTATDNIGLAQVRFANEDGNWGTWKALADPAAHTLTAGLSYKVVYAQVRDAAGNESAVVTAVSRLVGEDAPPPAAPDAIAPTLRAITLPATTAARTITIAIDATDDTKVTHVRFANEDGNWGAWGAFSANATHQLSAGYSIKGVYVQVRDAAGNESGAIYRTLLFAAG